MAAQGARAGWARYTMTNWNWSSRSPGHCLGSCAAEPARSAAAGRSLWADGRSFCRKGGAVRMMQDRPRKLLQTCRVVFFCTFLCPALAPPPRRLHPLAHPPILGAARSTASCRGCSAGTPGNTRTSAESTTFSLSESISLAIKVNVIYCLPFFITCDGNHKQWVPMLSCKDVACFEVHVHRSSLIPSDDGRLLL